MCPVSTTSCPSYSNNESNLKKKKKAHVILNQFYIYLASLCIFHLKVYFRLHHPSGSHCKLLWIAQSMKNLVSIFTS